MALAFFFFLMPYACEDGAAGAAAGGAATRMLLLMSVTVETVMAIYVWCAIKMHSPRNFMAFMNAGESAMCTPAHL